MPVGNTSSRPPGPDSDLDDAIDPWGVPLGRIRGTRFSLSYTVFIAAAILVGVVLVVSGRPGNADLPRAAALGTLFWISGWGIQILAHALLSRVFGMREANLNIGLVGVESATRSWTAGRSLIVAVGTVASLLVLGALYRLVEGGFQAPVLAPADGPTLTAPSIGFSKHDSIWKSGAWLCWIQALFQMCPLPRTQGRQVFTSLVGLVAGRMELETQEVILRRSLLVIAIMTVVVGLLLGTVEEQMFSANWPLFILLGVLLWVSARSPDLAESLDAFHASDPVRGADHHSLQVGADSPGIAARLRDSIRDRKKRKQLKKALQQERDEAVDAERLDEILSRLHREGIDSLDQEERRILERVSENLRKQRESNSGDIEDTSA